jgi:predicted TIM-barrel fold metal-dependent hydrolase
LTGTSGLRVGQEETRVQITDSQVHLWKKHSPERPWPPDGPSYAHSLDDFSADHVLEAMDAAGVDRAILVPPSFEGDYNDVCLAAARAHPERFAVMGRVTINDPGQVELVRNWRAQDPNQLGFRVGFTRGAARGWLTDGTAEWFWSAAQATRTPVMIHAPGQLEAVGRIAGRYPDLKLVVDHAGIPGTHRGPIDDIVGRVVALAERPNVAVKASSLPSIATDAYPYPSLGPQIARLVDAFGAARVFWGSDLSRLPCSYREAITHFTETLGFLSADDLELIMGRGIEDWLGWNARRTPTCTS